MKNKSDKTWYEKLNIVLGILASVFTITGLSIISIYSYVNDNNLKKENQYLNEWYLKDGESRSGKMYKIHNNELFPNDIWYSRDELVVGDNYACWYGADMNFDIGLDYCSRNIYVILFDENEIVSFATTFAFMNSKEDANYVKEQYRKFGYYNINNVVIFPPRETFVVGSTTKEEVINYYQDWDFNVRYY